MPPDVPAETSEETPGSEPSRLLLDQIADKWSILILASLCATPLRFNEIKRRIDGVTQKTLTQALRRLERNGILARTVIPSSQVAVEYSVTPLGRTLEEPFRVLFDWTVRHADDVFHARSDYDAKSNSDAAP
ncbi:helix-turn-helix transcriptional regulator [Bacillus sp. NP157]|nr:helix-turn-helix transcriptional regulator [Bacillus sp. NP157]